MRGANGESRAMNSPSETIYAAANAIASAENRVPQYTGQKKRWGGFWSKYWCFGSFKQKKRIGPAVPVSESSASHANVPAAEIPTQAPAMTLPFVAPPSSPASFLPSEPPSATQSPAGVVSLTSISASMYSPGPASIFAIGPYVHETQLVSPPVFSTFTTEPSTAPFTPPPESMHLTTPSSPEVPFAQFLGPNFQFGEAGQRFPIYHYEFQSYQLQPGSPVGQLISPSSGISGSGTSSPFPDCDFAAGLRFPEFRMGDPPKLFDIDKLSNREWGSCHGYGTLTPDATTSTPRGGFLLGRQVSETVSHPHVDKQNPTDQVAVNHRLSFDLTTGEVIRSVETEAATPSEAMSESLQNEATREREDNTTKMVGDHECRVGETSNERPEKAPADGEGTPHHRENQCPTLGSAKEFNFDNDDGVDAHKPIVSSDWWANEKVAGKNDSVAKNWSFFPMMQPGVS
ncbi:BTB/POZ domain-containing protein [Hibiscus syriacus]|uniref:BTB/POZ domain-containing protein n=1 Tax=Hibiscus syriacus TaxID=106335 RepID=A0A6A3CDA3_HIBSY|nr:uncharacterized protein LOC120199710 isoform X1 [Hibiscus syriacus]KAE8727305.1 BTB/POZ domain-containing protein [Hibiscus syriacus]